MNDSSHLRIYSLHKFLLILVLFAATPRESIAQEYYVAAPSLNLRETPDRSGKVLAVLKKGEAVLVIDDSVTDWVLVQYNDLQGYVFSTYLSEEPQSVTQRNGKSTEAQVLICNSSRAYAYHSYVCHGLARCKASVSRVSVSEARGSGYSPCKICY